MTELKRSLDLEPDSEQQLNKRPRKLKNRKFAVLICYCGHGYYGLQRNDPYKTIEGEFLKALHKAEIIDQEKFERPQGFRFQRAARTDKNVSALRQIFSCCLPEDLPQRVDKVNEHLPEEIRFLAAIRTTPTFDSRNFCDSRTYSYTFPTFAISPTNTLLSTYYRVDPKLIDKVNELISLYKGTHNFHNFTSGKKASENSAMRFIIGIECSQPFIYEDMEFAKITIKGQSFMLHQIRKMLGLVFAVMRGHADEDKIKEAFLSQKKDIPMAPGLGLLLENIHYDAYNRKFTGDGQREPLNWDFLNDEIEEFRKKFIFKIVYEEEKKKFSMMYWLDNLNSHNNIGGNQEDKERLNAEENVDENGNVEKEVGSEEKDSVQVKDENNIEKVDDVRVKDEDHVVENGSIVKENEKQSDPVNESVDDQLNAEKLKSIKNDNKMKDNLENDLKTNEVKDEIRQ